MAEFLILTDNIHRYPWSISPMEHLSGNKNVSLYIRYFHITATRHRS
nr:MAG TPA: hypothetical protein [Caudoviricetes sp.]